MGFSKCIRVILALVLPALALCQIQDPEVYPGEYRLPGDIYPLQQWVTIYTSLAVDQFCFWGSSEIQVKVVMETNQIVLHSSLLNVHTQDVNVRYVDSDQYVQLGEIEFDLELEFMIIPLLETLPIDAELIVYVPFDAPLGDFQNGYYRQSYIDAQGNEIWFSASYFFPGKARTAFVCFDEPGYKPVYSISLAHSNEFIALSNMDIKETNDVQGMDGWTMTTFNDTPNLSSYLVVMVLCQFEYIEVQNLSIPVTIWARSEVIDQLSIVQETVEKVWPAYNDLFAFQLDNLPQLFIVALPNYLFIQDSWGCLMIDELGAMYNPDFDIMEDIIDHSTDICNLLAKLWFGNLVTMEWWTDIFLSNSLSFYFKEFGLSVFFDSPLYIDVGFRQIHRFVMNEDSQIESSQAIVVPIEFPDDIFTNLTELFHRKSYMFIRQLIMIISYEAFLNGITNYLNDYQYGVATIPTFLEELNYAGQEAQTLSADFDLNVLTERWLYGKGYPMVQVNVDYDGQMASLSQIRFISETRLGQEERAQLEAECWPIPLSWVFSTNLNFDNYVAQDWLMCDSYLEVLLENFTEQDFVIFNVRLLGLYRVNYPDTVWLAIAEFLLNENQFTTIDVLNRMQIVSDALEIAWTGYLSYSIPFTIIPYLQYETMEPPLRTALNSLEDIRDRLVRTDLAEQFNMFVREFLQPLYMRYNDVSFVPDDMFEARFKLLVDAWSGTYQVSSCLEQSLQLLLQWYNTADPDFNNPINVEVRDTCYCYGIQQGDSELWNWMFQRFNGATNENEKSTILSGLGCTTDTQIMADFLQWSLDANIIDPQWFMNVFMSVFYNEQPTSFAVVFNFLINNFQSIIQVLANDMETACSLLSNVGSIIEYGDELDQFQAFLDSIQVQDCQSYIDDAIQDALNNISWHDLHDSEMYDLLSVNSSLDTHSSRPSP